MRLTTEPLDNRDLKDTLFYPIYEILKLKEAMEMVETMKTDEAA